jgi:hypothetical protein
MNLQNFEEFFDATILKRGFDYYTSGQVESLELDEDTWRAEVLGSDDYEVTVTLLENGEISETTCDCPYEYGMYCKHQAAVLYALRDQKSTKHPQKETKKEESLESILGQLNKETLVSIVLEIANQNKRIRKELLLRYSKKSDVAISAKDYLKTSIKSASRRGFVECEHMDHIIDAAYTVLNMADEVADTGEVLDAVSLPLIVLEEIMAIVEECDESDGDKDSVLSEAIDQIKELLSSNSLEEKKAEAVFDMVFTHATSEIYADWTEWRMEVLSTLIPLCRNYVNREKLEQYLSDGQSSSTTDWGTEYEKKEMQALQLQIIRTFDGDASAKQYLEQNVDNSSFRRIIVENAISGGDFEKALMMCLEGEKRDAPYVGFVSMWKNLRYETYEKTNDTAAQKNLARELLLQGDLTYFAKLKALYEESEWQTILPEIAENVRNNNHQDIYVEILIHENLKPQLLDYCKNNFLTSEWLFSHLLKKKKKDVDELFIKLIKTHAALANTRNQHDKI